MIEPLSRSTIDYLQQFGLGCVYITHDGEVGANSPAELARTPAAAAWWTRDRRTAHEVVRAIGQQRPADVEQATAEVLAAAKRLEVTLSCHSVVLARARAAISRLNGKLATAQQLGDLRFFNRAYREYRLETLCQGGRPMAYGAAVARLRKLLAGAAATGSLPAELLQAIFEG